MTLTVNDLIKPLSSNDSRLQRIDLTNVYFHERSPESEKYVISRRPLGSTNLYVATRKKRRENVGKNIQSIGLFAVTTFGLGNLLVITDIIYHFPSVLITCKLNNIV